MKTLKLFLFMALASLMSSCGNGGGVTPVSEKIQGPLGEYFAVVNKTYKAKDGTVNVEIKRIKAGFPEPWQEGMKVGYTEGEFEPHFTAEFQDPDGNVVSKDNTDIVWDRDDLVAIAALLVDESATVSFECSEEAAQFKLGSTFEVHGMKEEERTLNLDGNIGPYPIMMTIHIAPNGDVTGAYFYKKHPGNYLYVKGEKSDETLNLFEFVKDGTQSGEYEGKLVNDIYRGEFKTKSGEFDVLLKPTTEYETIDFSDIDFDSFYGTYMSYNDEEEEDADDYDGGYDSDYESDYDSDDNDYSSSSSSGSTDWDDLLDSYECLVDKSISCAERMKAGDMSAAAEFAELSSDAQELGQKLGNAQGQMSSSQMSRYKKLLNKLSAAAAKMR